MQSILYGLLSAAGLCARRTGPFQSVLLVQLLALGVLPFAAIFLGEPVISVREWLWCMAAGGFGVLALALLYQSFGEGQMSIAAPVSAVTSAALPIVVGIFTQGAQESTQVIGFGLALVAIWLISTAETGDLKRILQFKDLQLPIMAGVGFGLYFIFIYQGSQQAIIWPMVASRMAGMASLGMVMAWRRQKFAIQQGAWPLLVLNFLLDMAANVTFILAAQSGRMDVAAVLTSLYPGLTILLAWLILKEHVRRLQFVGILLALAAIALITI